MRPQVADVQEVVAQAEGGPFRQVVQAAPIIGSIAPLKLQVQFQIGDARAPAPRWPAGTSTIKVSSPTGATELSVRAGACT